MNFSGTLSPPSSSADSSDGNMNSPLGSQFSPGQLIYNATECTIMEENGKSKSNTCNKNMFINIFICSYCESTYAIFEYRRTTG